LLPEFLERNLHPLKTPDTNHPDGHPNTSSKSLSAARSLEITFEIADYWV
jgi:hypothetical protein